MKIFLLILFVLIPIVVNCICCIPSCHVGETSDWIGFWGAYTGSIISVCGSMWVFKKTFENDKNVREKEYNRENAKRVYDEKRKEIDDLSADFLERLEQLQSPILTNIVIDIMEENAINLDSDQRKTLMNYYYLLLSKKNSCRIKYSKYANKEPAKSFISIYIQSIDNILLILCWVLFGTNKTQAKEVANVVIMAGINQGNGINTCYEKMHVWIEYEKQELEKNSKNI